MKPFRYLLYVTTLPLLLWAPSAWSQTPSLNDTLKLSSDALQTADQENALHWAEQAISVHPGSAPAWKQYGRVLQLTGEPEKAITALETALTLHPKDSEVNSWLSELYLKNLTGDPLRQKLRKLPVNQTQGWQAEHISLAFLLLESGRAESLVIWMLNHPPGETPASVSSAFNALANRDPSPARTLLSSASPASPPALQGLLAYELGRFYLQRKQADTALIFLTQAEISLPDAQPIQREKGWALFRLKLFEQAADTWSPHASDNDYPVEWHFWIARARMQAGQVDLAAKAVDRYRIDHPLDVDALLLKADLLTLQDQDAQRPALLAEIPDEELRRDVRLLSDAQSLRRNAQYAEAAALLAPARNRASTQQERMQHAYRDLLAEWSLNTPITERWRILETRNTLTPGDPVLLRDLAWSYWADDQMPKALETLRESLRLGVEPFSDTLTQAMARLVEEGYTDQALELFNEFAPDQSLSETAIDLFHRNRLRAATPLLETAWTRGENLPQTGLYLSYLQALDGRCSQLAETLSPALEQFKTQPDEETRDLILETLFHCPENRELVLAVENLPGMQDRDQVYAPRVTDILQAYAMDQVLRQQIPEARQVLARVNERDPLRPVWSLRLELAMLAEDDNAISHLIDTAPVEDLPPAEQSRFEGFTAFHRGQLEEAARKFTASLEANPDQLDLLPRLFRLHLALGESEQADEVKEKLLLRVDSGETLHAATLAEMFTLQGDPAQAADYWYIAHLRNPRSIYTISATARSLADSCRADEALRFLEDLLPVTPDPGLYALAAEIALWTGDLAAADRLATAGLALAPEHTGLLRILAESAEAREDSENALSYAQHYLLQLPENLSMQRLTGRSLMALNRPEEAQTLYTSLREEYPDQAFPLLRLREIQTAQGNTDAALETARTLYALAPGNPEWQRLYGASLAENRSFRDAIQTLEPLAEQPTENAVPALLFANLTTCNLPGRVRIQQVENLLHSFQEQGRTPILPHDQNREVPKVGKRVVLIFLDPEPATIPPLIRLLASYNAPAVWVTRLSSSNMVLSDSRPHQPASADLIEDSRDAFVIYPSDHTRLPALRVPARWTADDITTWIQEENPLTQSRRTLAKVLYWHNQNQRADYWFTQSASENESPFDLAYNRGMNALRGGDLHLAQEELNTAAQLQPDHPGVQKGLNDLHQLTRPSIASYMHAEDDSDDRQLDWAGLHAQITLHSRFQLWISGEERQWSLEDEQENAERILLGLQFYPAPFHQLRLQGWMTSLGSGDDRWGGDAAYTLPSAWLRGSVQLTAGRDDVQTLGGIRRELTEDSAGLHLYSRLMDNWDLFLDGSLVQRSDDNDGWLTEGRFIRRLAENPYFGLGYRFRFMDTQRDDPDYYAPEELEKHQIYLNYRDGTDSLHYSFSGEAGYAREQQEDWEFVWSARGDLTLELPWNFWLSAGLSHLESPNYTLDRIDARIGLRF